MQLWSKLTFLFLLIHLNLANLGYYDFEMPEAFEGNGPDEFINLPLDFGAHQQLRVKPFPSRMDSLKYTFSRMGKYSRSLPYNAAKARKMPCCTETIGTHTCNELRNKRPLAFRKRCKADADFAILQCCQTCRTNVAELGRELFAFGLKSRHCFDRHNRNYCSHFIHQSGMWAANAGKLVNCNGESASLAFRVCRRSCGFCEPELYEKPNRNCTKGSGVNPTVKGGKQGEEKTTEKPKEKTDKNIEKGTTTAKNVPSPSSTSPFPPGSIQTPQTSTNKPPIPISSTTASPPTTPSKMPPSPKPPPSPSPPPPTAPPTLHSTVLPPTTPKLIPCPSPKPLPPLPQIPCRPIEPISPLTEPTISIPQVSPRPFAPNPPPPPPLPPIHPIMPPPHPFLPPHPSLPGWPVHPILPRPIPRPRPRPPMPLPQRPPPKITIEWKPMPQPRGGGEVGPWPEWPWPFPDEVIEAILNQLSGVDDGHRVRGGIGGRRGEKEEECGECILDEMGERREMEEEIKREKEHFDLENLLGFGGEERK